MHRRHHRLSIWLLVITMAVILAVAGIIVGLAVSTSSPGTSTDRQTNSANWPSMCQSAAGKSGAKYTATDENGDKATVTYCGYTVTDSANGQQALPGDVFVNTVFLVTADQAASFDSGGFFPSNNAEVGLYVGSEANCSNDNENTTACPQMGDNGYDGNEDTVYQGHPQVVMTSTGMPEQDASGQMLVIIADSDGGTTVVLNSRGTSPRSASPAASYTYQDGYTAASQVSKSQVYAAYNSGGSESESNIGVGGVAGAWCSWNDPTPNAPDPEGGSTGAGGPGVSYPGTPWYDGCMADLESKGISSGS